MEPAAPWATMELLTQPSIATRRADMTEIEATMQEPLDTLQKHIAILDERIQLLETPVAENAARTMALMTVLRATVQCSGNQPVIAQMCENMLAMIQVQPGVLLGDKALFEKTKAQVEWLLQPPASLP